MNVTVEGVRKSAVKQITSADTTVYEVTSGRTFYATGLVIVNPISGSDALVSIYDGPSAGGVRPIPPVYVKEKTVEKIDKAVFDGAPEFLSSVVAVSTLSGVWLQIIGVER